ncbi:MAG: hypothetical protein JSS86_08375, partial [Cyanobacteria bacterium SZAS LIN-2]|nr:hypothetical protein [Cyanobacteria bacterium SZAS LIN-2]
MMCALCFAFETVRASETGATTQLNPSNGPGAVVQDDDWLQPNSDFGRLYPEPIPYAPHFSLPNGISGLEMRLGSPSIYSSRFANHISFQGHSVNDWGRDRYGIANALYGSPLGEPVNFLGIQDGGLLKKWFADLFPGTVEFLAKENSTYPVLAEVILAPSRPAYGEIAAVGQTFRSMHPPDRTYSWFSVGSKVSGRAIVPPSPIECCVLRDYLSATAPRPRIYLDLDVRGRGRKHFHWQGLNDFQTRAIDGGAGVPQPRLKEITMVGNKEISAYEISRFFDGQLSRPIDPGAVVNAVAKAEELYHERGFVLAKITEVEDAEKGEIKLVIDEGILDAIEISGNKKTKGFIIRNNVRLKPGSAYNERQVSSDLRKLFVNGYFTDIKHSLVSSEKSPGKFILKIEVAEKRSGSVSFGHGVFDSLTLPANSIDPYGDDATGPSKVDSLFYRNMLSTSASVTPGTRDAIIDATQGSYVRFPITPTAGPGAILRDDSTFNGFVKIVADRTESDLEKNAFLGTGNAVAIIGGQNSKLEADTILYDQAKGMIDARGNVKILRNGQLTTGA